MLDKIRLLGTTRELDTYLRPHEEKEFTVYDGPRFSRSPGGVAELVYKTTQEGDYFQSLHDITFAYASDKLYSVSELRFHPPVRDIFG
jgi:hypothetical protein